MPSLLLLGPPGIVDRAGLPVPLPRRKQRALLALLASRAGTAVGVGEIVDVLWGGRPPRSARANLYSYVCELRRALAHGQPTAAPRPGRTPPGYRLELLADECDVDVFSRLARDGRRALLDGRPAEAVRQLGGALELWRGDALQGLEGFDCFAPVVARLEQARLHALQDQFDARMLLGQYADLSVELAEAVERYPLQERLWGQLMLALHRAGRRADGLWAYRRLCVLLDAELGVQPGAEVQAIHRDIRCDTPQRTGRWSGHPDRPASTARASGMPGEVRCSASENPNSAGPTISRTGRMLPASHTATADSSTPKAISPRLLHNA